MPNVIPSSARAWSKNQSPGVPYPSLPYAGLPYAGLPRAGAMLILIVFCLIILFVAAAISIDVAYMHVTRAELRTATDSAARAGAEALGRLQNRTDAINAAREFASRNQVAGQALILDDADIVLGSNQLVGGKFQFIPDTLPINSVRVDGRRTADSPGGVIPLFFGGMLGQNGFAPSRVATAARVDMDIALVLDISGSMGSQNRFNGLKNAVSVFVRELQRTPQDEFCSMAVYSTNARRVVPLTSDLNLLNTELNRFRPDGFTAIGRGMEEGLDSFSDPNRRPFAFKTMIVMTDGNHNRGVNPTAIVPRAVRENVTVHTITFSTGANQTLMRDVANAGNGIHLHADTNEQLEQAFREIAQQLSVMLIE